MDILRGCVMREHCWNNRPHPANGYWTVVRDYMSDGRYTYKQQYIENRMSKECGQPGKDLPPAAGCVGCDHLQTATPVVAASDSTAGSAA